MEISSVLQSLARLQAPSFLATAVEAVRFGRSGRLQGTLYFAAARAAAAPHELGRAAARRRYYSVDVGAVSVACVVCFVSRQPRYSPTLLRIKVGSYS